MDWDIISPTAVNTDINWLVAGVYTLTLTETDASGCSTTQQVVVTVNALPIATISYDGSPYCATGVATVTLTGQNGGTFSSTAGLVIDPATGEVDLATSTTGTYTVTYDFGDGTCTSSTTAEIIINALPVATISFDGSPYCATGAATVTLTGQNGGTFSSTAGLVIDPATGEVDLEASTTGTYTVTYDFGDGTCTNSTTAEIIINTLPVATISYDGSPYCATGVATVTLTGQNGGTFSSTAGLVIDPATGEVDLAASTTGTYTVTYDFGNGTCTNSTTTEIIINALPVATISYDGSPYCATGAATVTRTGQNGGTFSSTAGLVIDPATGEVDLAASITGTYTVTYDFGDGTCTNSTTTEIIINPTPTTSPIWHN